MVNQLLTDDNLKVFIEGVNITKEEKDSLIASLPALTEEERIKLLEALKDIQTLDEKQQDAVNKLKNNWQI